MIAVAKIEKKELARSTYISISRASGEVILSLISRSSTSHLIGLFLRQGKLTQLEHLIHIITHTLCLPDLFGVCL